MKCEISVFLRWNVAKRLKIRNTRQNDSETVNCLANPIVPTVVEYNEMSSLLSLFSIKKHLYFRNKTKFGRSVAS